MLIKLSIEIFIGVIVAAVILTYLFVDTIYFERYMNFRREMFQVTLDSLMQITLMIEEKENEKEE